MEQSALPPTIPSVDGELGATAERGASIGRFLVLGPLGIGGMGAVVSAYDPQLDRKVAIKLLRGDWEEADREAAHDGLMREAQTMARLTHPNVVAVYEVGVTEHGGYLVMEQVEGTTLRVWLQDAKRRWDEILPMLLGAGAGLAAAHDEGIVHRDFKPDNVLVGHDERPRVTDFGLAGTAVRGAGTPGYMAPEQSRGEPVDARADQFAYCVTVWEALQGERPPPDAVPPAARRAPTHIFRALARGLRAQPDDRWPSMEALIAALRPRAGRVVQTLLVVGAVALAGISAFLLGRERATLSTCEGAETRLVGVWDPTRREAVRAAFAKNDLPYRDATWASARGRLDDYARAWTAMHREACRATRVEGRQSDTLLDLRMACLERNRAVLGALTELWARGVDADMLERSVEAAGGLPPIADCADAHTLGERAPLPAQHAAEIAAARRSIDAARAGLLARPRDGAAAASAARAAAEATGWPQVRAEAAMVEAEALLALSDKTAEARLREVAQLAGATRDDRLVARALILLARYLAGDEFSSQSALLVADLAAGAVARAGSDPELRIQLLHSQGLAHRTASEPDAAWTYLSAARAQAAALYGATRLETLELVRELVVIAEARGDYFAARRLAEDNLATMIALLGSDHPRVAAQLGTLGTIAWDLGDNEGSIAYHRQALAIRQKVFGADSLAVANTMNNLAVALQAIDLAESTALGERALAIREKQLGPHHQLVASSLTAVASTRRKAGRYPEAQALLQRALAIRLERNEPSYVAYSHEGLGWLNIVRGDFPVALEHLRAAAAIRETMLGPAHHQTAVAKSEVALVLATLGRCAEADRLVAASLPTLQQLLGPASTETVWPLVARGRCQLAAGRAGDAAQTLAQAVELAEKGKMPVADRGSARWALVAALWAAGRRDDARATARQAADELAADGDGAREAALARAWLAAHRR